MKVPQSSFLLVQPSGTKVLALLLSSICQVSTAYPPPFAPPPQHTQRKSKKRRNNSGINLMHYVCVGCLLEHVGGWEGVWDYTTCTCITWSCGDWCLALARHQKDSCTTFLLTPPPSLPHVHHCTAHLRPFWMVLSVCSTRRLWRDSWSHNPNPQCGWRSGAVGRLRGHSHDPGNTPMSSV